MEMTQQIVNALQQEPSYVNIAHADLSEPVRTMDESAWFEGFHYVIMMRGAHPAAGRTIESAGVSVSLGRPSTRENLTVCDSLGRSLLHPNSTLGCAPCRCQVRNSVRALSTWAAAQWEIMGAQ